jgi:hypothetical protein
LKVQRLAPAAPSSSTGAASELADSAEIERFVRNAYRSPTGQPLRKMLIAEAAAFKNADAAFRSTKAMSEG